MRSLANKFEDFNLGRELKFRGSKKNLSLYLVHGLDGKLLESSLKAIKEKTDFKEVLTCHYDDLNKLLELDPKSFYIYTVHLPLDEEISLHKTISKWAFDHEVYQVNPYNKIAKIFDDKFLFYALMTANEIRQPFTLTIHTNHKFISDEEKNKLSKFQSIAVKPRHGTEKIDFAVIPVTELNVGNEAISKILKYDDCLLQEYIKDAKETKALYIFGDLYIQENWGDAQKKFIAEIVNVIDEFAWANQIIMPEIFSIDLMKQDGSEIIVLEANIRPAAIYKYQLPS